VSYKSVADHRTMALDHIRNEAYASALREVITPHSVVLDLGAGTGVLGLIAARLGARRVYLVEPEPILDVAAEIVRANGLDDRVRCVRGRMEDVELPEQADVIVSALTGNFLHGEGLLGSLLLARETALKPGGHLVPSSAEMEAVPVQAPIVHDREIAGWSKPEQGADLSVARAYAANTVYYKFDNLREVEWLAEPARFGAIDFRTATTADVRSTTTSEIRQSGTCHGWIGWFRMQLGSRWLSTSPREPKLHWSPAFLPIDPPLPVERGELMTLDLRRPEKGDWTWSVRARSGQRDQSTFLSRSISMTSLKQSASLGHPSLSVEGRLLREVLDRCDGKTTVDDIARTVHGQFPKRCPTIEDAERIVRNAVDRFASDTSHSA
jgi:predicted RNA methylase